MAIQEEVTELTREGDEVFLGHQRHRDGDGEVFVGLVKEDGKEASWADQLPHHLALHQSKDL